MPDSTPIIRAPLSYQQENLWYLCQLEPQNLAFNETNLFRIDGQLDVFLLQRALEKTVERHPSLRTVFLLEKETPEQITLPTAPLELPVVDSPNLVELRARAAQEGLRPFNLERGPLVRFSLLRISPIEHYLSINMHHIIFDGWSLQVLLRDLRLLYAALQQDGIASLPKIEISLAEFSSWQRTWLQGQKRQGLLGYWKAHLAGDLPNLELPLDHPYPANPQANGARLPFRINSKQLSSLKSLAYQVSVFPFTLYTTAYFLLIQRYSGQDDLILGCPFANRSYPELKSSLEPVMGMFINTLPLRVNLEGNPSLGEAIRRVDETIQGASAHQAFPFEQLVAELNPARTPGKNPIFQAAINFHTFFSPPPGQPALAITFDQAVDLVTPFDLSLEIGESKGQLQCALRYNTTLFEPAIITRLAAHYQAILRQLPQTLDLPIRSIPILDENEQKALRDGGFHTSPGRAAGCLHDLMQPHVQASPNAPALVFREQTLSYAELDKRANRLARFLQQRGVADETIVGLYLPRNSDLIVAQLAVLKAGGAYLPLDTLHPPERTRFMLADASPHLVLTSGELALQLPADTPLLLLETAWPEIEHYDSSAPACPAKPDSLAYVIYTSGSTGRPKGVLTEHRGAANYIQELIEAQQLIPGERVLQFTSLTFDPSVRDTLGTLAFGGTILLTDDDQMRDPAALLTALHEQKATCILSMVPTLLRHLLRQSTASLAALRLVMPSGENLENSDLRHLWQAWGGHIRVVNQYGPTECSMISAYYVPQASECQEEGFVPIGRPPANVRLLLLDETQAIAPEGAIAEIFIGGAGVTRGYLNRPELTAEKFIPDPFHSGERLYRTGDLGRWRADGVLEFHGRRDKQVKIRGYRVELAEIEAALRQHSSVLDAAVILENAQLDAYLVFGQTHPGTSELRTFLQETLPFYMIPSTFTALTSLPRTATGKIDRKNLPALEMETPAQIEPPANLTEKKLARIWREILGLSVISVTDNFFALGGHSLLAARLFYQIKKEFGQALPFSTLFKHGTVRQQAAVLQQSQPPASSQQVISVEPTLPRNETEIRLAALWAEVLAISEPGVDEDFFALGGDSSLAARLITRIQQEFGERLPIRLLYETGTIADLARALLEKANPLSPVPQSVVLDASEVPASAAQESQWFLQNLSPSSDAYHLLYATGIEGELEISALEKSLNLILSRQAALRTVFSFNDQGLVQRILPCKPVLLSQIDLRQTPEALQVQLESLRTRPYNLASEPPVRFCLYHLAEQRFALAMAAHHIAFDAWSERLFMKELQQAYSALHAGHAPELPWLPRQYIDFAREERAWMQTPAYALALEAWQSRLGRRPPAFELPLDFPRPPVLTYQAGQASFSLSSRQREDLITICVHQRTTLFSLLLSALYAAFYRLSGQERIILGVPFANRNHDDVENLIGMFVNTLPICARLEPGLTFESLLKQASAEMLIASEQQAVPFSQILSGLDLPRDTSRPPLYQVVVNFHHLPIRPQAGELKLFEISPNSASVRFDLEINPTDTGHSLEWEFRYNRDLYRPETINQLCSYLNHLLDEIILNPAIVIGSLPFRDNSQRQRIIYEWNQTATPQPFPSFLTEFERLACQTPSQTALRFEETTFSYAELNARANQFAHYLRQRGIGVGAVIGICLRRSPEMVAALLGLLKAGAAYLPLDPSFPVARLEFMLENSSAALLLTQSSLKDLIHAEGVPVAEIESIPLSQFSTENLPLLAGPEDLTYIMYTSGSTGRPKGVQVTHGGVSNLLGWMAKTLEFSPSDSILGITTISFDISVLELFLPLSCGGTLILLSAETVQDTRLLIGAFEKYRPTCMQATPSLWKILVTLGWPGAGNLQIISGGESLPADLAAELLPRCARLWNAYGPTETTIYTHACQITSAKPPIVIGRPIANLRSYILNESHQPVSPGAAGEIYIAGAGLARGYLKRPELTAESFLPDPFFPGERMYRSGDLGRYQPDGSLEVLGRTDFQVKVRGYRVELGEIETALKRHPAVRDAVVIGVESSLVAHYLPVGEPVPASELRDFLGLDLPLYATPTLYIAQTAFPLTSNQKIDRKALEKASRLFEDALSLREQVQPANALEAQMLAIWQEVLQVSQIGVEDNFFELGGHSLLAALLLTRIEKKLGVRISLASFFRNDTIRSLVSSLEMQKRSSSLGNATARQPVLVEQNATSADLPTEPVTRLFERHAAQTPFAPAVFWNDKILNYQNLNEQANRLARLLQANGVGPEIPVALHLEPSPRGVIAMLAILKAGGVCLPIPLKTPLERMKFMLADSGAQLFISEASLQTALTGLETPVLWLDSALLAAGASENLSTAPAIDQAALIFYTSGSTGQPKGVQVLHQGIIRLVVKTNYITISPEDVFAHISNIGFDAATFEIWGPLTNGASLVILPSEILLTPKRFGTALQKYRVSVIFLSTGLFNLIAQETPALLKDVRWVAFGGEKADYESVRRILEYGKPPHLVNAYGPTETTTFATFYEIPPKLPRTANLSIGYPLSHTSIHLVDEKLQPVPPGEEGEILIGGLGVARGYLNRPELTQEKFIPDPFTGQGNLYRTGDLARLLPDGSLEFIGRRDQQVKIRGFRIELDEIELCLREHPAVKEAAVILQTSLRGKEIVAFWVPIQAGLTPDLRADLQTHLPAYMLPSAFVTIQALPLNPNGKVDRRALEQTPVEIAPLTAAEPPDNPFEQRLVKIWQEMLGLPAISVSDDFFALGGHSLLAARLFYRLEKEFGQSLPLATLFKHTTIRQLANLLQQNQAPVVSQVLVVQPAGKQTPLILIPGADASPLYLRDFCLAFAPHRPVAIVMYPGWDNLPPEPTIADYARLMLPALRQYQPEGPYQLIGHSLGGLIAIEMAQLLAHQSQSVTFLGLIDTLPPGEIAPPINRWQKTKDRLTNIAKYGFDAHRKGALRGLILGQISRFWGLPLVRAIAARLLSLPNLETIGSLFAEKNCRTDFANLPLSPAIFLATETRVEKRAACKQSWSEALTPTPRFYDLPGDHLSTLEAPHVAKTALRVQTLLDNLGNPALTE